MNRSGVARSLRVAAAALAGLIAASAVAPAFADDDHDHGRREWREHEWREHERHERYERHVWRPYYYGTPGYVVPAPVYAPPAVIYAPPPAPVYAPPVAPSVNLVFPLHF